MFEGVRLNIADSNMDIKLKNLFSFLIPTTLLTLSIFWWKRKYNKHLSPVSATENNQSSKRKESTTQVLIEEEVIVAVSDEVCLNEIEMNLDNDLFDETKDKGDVNYTDNFENDFDNTLSLENTLPLESGINTSKRVRNQSSCDGDSAFVEDYSSDGVSNSGSDFTVNKSPEHFNVVNTPVFEEITTIDAIQLESENSDTLNYRDWYGNTIDSPEYKVMHWGSQPVSENECDDQRLIKEDSIGGVSIEKLSIVLEKEYNERKSKTYKTDKTPKKNREKNKMSVDKSPIRSRSPKKSPKSSLKVDSSRRKVSSPKKKHAEIKNMDKPWRDQNESPKKVDEYIVCEFEIPEELCGKLIGKHGKSVREVHESTGATVCIETEQSGTKRIVSIAGLFSQVQKAEKYLVLRFKTSIKKIDAEIFPELPMSLNSISLPCGFYIDVIVTAIISAGNVFVQIFDAEVDEKLMKLQTDLANKYTTPPQKLIYVDKMKPKVDDICVGFLDNIWCRLRVLEYTKDEYIIVSFVDYGGIVTVPWQMVLRISREFLEMPAQTVECYMSDVFPLANDADYSYSANITCSQLVEGKALKAYVHSSCENIPCIELFYFNEDTNEDVSVNQSLIKWGLVSGYAHVEAVQENDTTVVL